MTGKTGETARPQLLWVFRVLLGVTVWGWGCFEVMVVVVLVAHA